MLKLPNCRKCGAQLEEGATYCHVCGTPVSPGQPTTQLQTRRKRPFPLAAWILIAIIGTAAIFGVLFFLPLVPISGNDYEEVSTVPGIDTLNLTLGADIARINVTFVNLPNQLVTLNVTMTGNAGLWYSPGTLHVTFDNTTNGNTLTVTSDVTTGFGFLKPFLLNLMCDLKIDASLASSLTLRTAVGEIDFSARTNVDIDSLNLVATTGAIHAQMLANSRLNGNVSLTTTTGSVDLFWRKVITTRTTFVTAVTTTGGVAIDINQNDGLQSDVIMTGRTTTGGVNLNMTIANDVGAYIQSSVTTGSISVIDETNFTGDKSPLKSINYPATNNFNVSLGTTTGGITLDTRYNP